MKFKYVLILSFIMLAGNRLHAQKDTWTQRSERKVADSEIYRTLLLNENILRQVVETSGQKQVLELPLPDGKNAEFILSKNQVMAPELAAKFPMIRSFNGISKDGRYSAKVDFNGTALYATVRTDKGLVYIDPDNREKPGYYKSYYTREYKNNKKKLPVFIEPELPNSGKSIQLQRVMANNRANAVNTVSGGQMRKYRIAIASNSDYSNFHGGTTVSVLSAMVTTMNRVNGIYENDLSITMELIADNDQLIFLTAASDPYNGLTDPESFLDANTSVLNNAVGGNSYDIGHVFTTSSGGVASLGSVCTSRKALGTTGIGQPVGDPFDVDFVAHEIGHQFGGNHTFNGTQGNCAGGNRIPNTAYEPGSGSTIQAYAGICGSDNLQNNSDPFFHAISLEEIVNFSTEGSGNDCPVTTETGNVRPIVKVDETVYSIPINTPFQLNAEGSDINGDNLTYSWEQFDLGPAGAPNNPVGNAPIFRAFTPTSDSFRVFPRIETVLGSSPLFGERLPTTERTLNFRVVVRDNNPVGGGIVTDDVTVDVVGETPFRITSQSTNGISYIGGSTQEVTWDVSGTNSGLINTPFVKILLSSDGGQTFDHVLLESTENDGLAEVRIPEIVAVQARIKIEAIDNIFFNINSRNFAITEASQAGYSLRVNPTPLAICAPDNAVFEIFVDGFGGFNQSVNLSSEGLDAALSIDIANSILLPGESTIITISNTESAPQSENTFTINGNSTVAGTQTKEINLTILDGSTTTTSLIFPSNQEVNVPTIVEFNWEESNAADSYRFELATDESFQNIVLSRSSEINTSFMPEIVLDEGVQYYWRVAINNQCGTGDFVTSTFRTETFEVTSESLTNLGIEIDPNTENTISSTITITEDLLVDDINIRSLDITHTYINDLTVTLQSPAGTRVVLLNDICDSENNVLTNFDDESFNLQIACPPIGNITYRPQNPLSAFDGESAMGDWTLEITDNAIQDGGTLNGWTIDIGTISRQLTLSVSSLNPLETELEWEILNTNNDITGFEVEQKRIGDVAFSKVADVEANMTSFIVTDLDAETIYQFRVRAVFGNEFGDFSNTVEILTVPSAPQNLRVTLNSFGLLIISWIDDLETEEGFVLELSVTDQEQFEVLETFQSNENSFIFDNFDPGDRLLFRVKAFNATGDSPYSEVVEFVISSAGDLLESVNLYPNPGNDIVRLQGVALSEINTVEISDMTGKSITVDISREDQTNYVIDTSSLRSGIYLIRLQNGRATKTFRWVKK